MVSYWSHIDWFCYTYNAHLDARMYLVGLSLQSYIHLNYINSAQTNGVLQVIDPILIDWTWRTYSGHLDGRTYLVGLSPIGTRYMYILPGRGVAPGQ